jgi:PHS family inorganic phosphate transporter-like MFS transporter
MLGYVYWPSSDPNIVPQVPSTVKTAMMCSTLAGTMIGQVGFGFAADVLGRRKMYGLELVIIIVGTMFLLMSSNGERNSMHVAGWLITWRAIMGMHHLNSHLALCPVYMLTMNCRHWYRCGLSPERRT